MKKIDVISLLIALVTSVVVFSLNSILKDGNDVNLLYQVYLNGEKIGVIEDKDELYDLINDKQKEIKLKYDVDNVYPPNDFNIKKLYTYEDDIVDISEIYSKIAAADDFTIKGYQVNIKPKEGEEIKVNILNKKIFEEAINNFVMAFVDEETYTNYVNGEQEEITEVGSIIENMNFDEAITIKEAYVSVNEKIYTDAMELSQYLLFGSNAENKTYTVQAGDTIASISDANKLNPEEFLIANPRFKSEDSLLAINDLVNITLIDPVITLTYQLYSVEDVEQYFEKTTVYDKTKPSSYSEITQPGVNGITRVTSRYAVINGEQTQGIVKISEEVIREKVNQITTKGNKKTYYGTPVNLDGDWAWPTNSGYIITSPYGWRWGKYHDAIDIALGYGIGSPIYSAGDGVVADVFYQSTGGKMITIDHGNNIFTMYAHLNSQLVKKGQAVKRGEKIGTMGNTGFSTGPHLHFAVSQGMPYNGSYKFFNPLSLYK